MRHQRTTALAMLVLSVTAGLPLAGSAQAASADLYVGGSTCSNTAPDAGTEQDPYCSPQVAADAAQPGQTVHLSAVNFYQSLHLTHSGRPGAPITFVGNVIPSSRQEDQQSTVGPLLVDGVSDVTLRQIKVAGGTSDVTVTGSDRITLDRLALPGYQGHANPTVHVTGHSSGVTLSRSRVGAAKTAVEIDQSVQHAVVTTNDIEAFGDAVRVTGAADTAVTSNTVYSHCSTSVVVAGTATGTTVENNVLSGRDDDLDAGSSCAPAGWVDLSVSADSAATTTADYNAFLRNSHTPYSWAGQPYSDAAALHTATHQAGHDLLNVDRRRPSEGSPLIDSADQNAPGELDTDFNGNPRVDDPNVPNTGTGVGYYDRGAYEFGDPMQIGVAPVQQFTGDNPYEVTFSGTFATHWGPATASLSFGDDSDPVPFTGATLKHVYPRAGTFTAMLTVTDAAGTRKIPQTVLVREPAAPKLTMEVSQLGHVAGMATPHEIWVAEHLDNTWPVVSNTIDFGDGAKSTGNAASAVAHTYAKPGDYTVTVTVTDSKGQTAKATAQASVGDAFVQLTPTRLLDTRKGTGTPVGPGQSIKIDVAHAPGVKSTPSAVLLNLTATRPTADSFVTAFPTGTPRPTVSSLNFTAGQTVANAAVVPVGDDGTVTLYNHSGSTQLVADLAGYYTSAEPGTYFNPLDSQRVADTRSGQNVPKGKLGPGGTVTIPLRGGVGHDFVPADATSVVLNLTATEATEPGYVSAQAGTSAINFAAGQTVANQVTLPIAPDGTVTLFNHNGQVHLVADVQGSYGPGKAAYVPVTPARFLDTRTDRSTFHAQEWRQFRIGGKAGVPAGAKAVLVNLTAVKPTAAGYLGAGDQMPGKSSALNFVKGQTVANLVWVRLVQDTFDIYNFAGNTDVVVDVQGYAM